MKVSLIVARAENGVIGNNNDLIWHLPADLKYFKNTTMGKSLIMGRKTFESFEGLLPGRRNIIITRNENYLYPGAEVFHSLQEAIVSCKGEEEVFIAGGAEIYKIAIPLCDLLYITEIHKKFEGDTSFPDFDASKFKLLSQERHSADEKNKMDYSFCVYKRKD